MTLLLEGCEQLAHLRYLLEDCELPVHLSGQLAASLDPELSCLGPWNLLGRYEKNETRIRDMSLNAFCG